MKRLKIGILHPGHMGVAVAASARNSGHDVFWASEGRSLETGRRAAGAGLADAGSVRRMCEVCEVIASVCPPEFAEKMAGEIAQYGFRGIYIDANAISPQRAQRIGEVLEAGGARFVDGCIIGLPATAPGQTWICLSGKHAESAVSCFAGGPLEVECLGGEIGKASALKMCYSAQAKGVAALSAAVLGAADGLGVLSDLERQWSRSGPPFAQAVASIQHTAPKAWRFVAEMQEIVDTFESVGMPGDFHRAAGEIYARLAPLKGTQGPDFRDALEKLTGRATVKA
jgi:3-hydroxyisobutyrate dehydrogenase-like beta-hydroxyacid dehydrogenase